MVGGLALLCLVLFAALAFEATSEAGVRLDASSAAGAPAAAPAAPAPTRAPAASSQATTPAATSLVEALPMPDTLLTGIERASSGPLEGELERLVAGVAYGFGSASAEVEPNLRPYVAHVAGRMNVHPGAWRLRVAAPEPALAERRAGALRAAFAAAGVAPNKLDVAAEPGAAALEFARR